MKRNRFTALMIIAAAVAVMMPAVSSGVPTFARAEQMSCNECHTIFPQLNETGRLYKEGGYSFVQELDLDGSPMEGTFPGSAIINLRMIDKRTSKAKTTAELSDKDKQLKTRGLHEVEIFFAGMASPKISYFLEIEAEDAIDFNAEVTMGAVGFALSPTTAVHAGYGSPFWADGHNTVNYRHPNRNSWVPKKFMPGNSQFVSLSTRATDQVQIIGAWHGNAGDVEGHDPKDFSGRIVADVNQDFSIGAFGTVSKAYNSTTGKSEDKTTTFGADFQAFRGPAAIHGLFGIQKDDVSDTQETFVGLEGNIWATSSGGVIYGPSANIGSYTANDGEDRFTEAGVFFNIQLAPNAMTQFGWEGELSVPDSSDPEFTRFKESRLTWVALIGM